MKNKRSVVLLLCFLFGSTAAVAEDEYLPFIPLLLGGKEYTVTPSAGVGGSIDPATPQSVAYGATQAFTITADTGYGIESVGGTCGGDLVDNTYTTAPITKDCTVVASFVVAYTVTLSASVNGSIDPDTPQLVNSGGFTSFTVTPYQDYNAAICGDCPGELDGNIYNVGPVNADCDAQVAFFGEREVVSAGCRIWLDSNLGASRVATSSTDADAYGDLYQWGRRTDGHEKRDSGTFGSLSGSDTPGHPYFILAPNWPLDWRTGQNNSLWQISTGTNNPCPDGFRLPTITEWEDEINSWSTRDSTGAYNSPLKIPLAGYRFGNTGDVNSPGGSGYYWSSTTASVNPIGQASRSFNLGSASARTDTRNFRADGQSVRCIQEEAP